MRWALFCVFTVLAVLFTGVLIQQIRRRVRLQPALRWRPNAKETVTGFITDFLDTLGIGSFATTTALCRFWRMVPDEQLPATLNMAHTLPTIAQALVFIGLIPVEPLTLLSMIAAAGVGAWWGSGVSQRLPKRYIQLTMGLALATAAVIMSLSFWGVLPSGGNELGLSGAKLLVAVLGNFVLGVLMTMGIGLYAPCMILVSVLGMNPLAAFPIMMGSCAFLMPLSSMRFARGDRWQPSVVVGMVLAGVPAVLLAAFVVRSLPLEILRGVVIAVVLYVAFSLWRDAMRPFAPTSAADPIG